MSEGTWYRTGLVSLANGSDLVAGAGTEFIANVLPGAIFFAPEGLYEVERAVSDTQLKLVEPYAGPTVAGTEFAIAPTQGAVVQATKQLQAFLSELGPLKQAWESGDLDPKGLATKGVKNTVEDLPAIGNTPGDAWLVDGVLYMWTGSAWSNQGSTVTTPELEAVRDQAIAAKNTAQTIATNFGDVAGAVGAATTQATNSGLWAGAALGAQTAAELARDATVAAGRLRASIAIAQADAAIPVGDGFVAPLADGSLQAYRKESALPATALGEPLASQRTAAKGNWHILGKPTAVAQDSTTTGWRFSWGRLYGYAGPGSMKSIQAVTDLLVPSGQAAYIDLAEPMVGGEYVVHVSTVVPVSVANPAGSYINDSKLILVYVNNGILGGALYPQYFGIAAGAVSATSLAAAVLNRTLRATWEVVGRLTKADGIGAALKISFADLRVIRGIGALSRVIQGVTDLSVPLGQAAYVNLEAPLNANNKLDVQVTTSGSTGAGGGLVAGNMIDDQRIYLVIHQAEGLGGGLAHTAPSSGGDLNPYIGAVWFKVPPCKVTYDAATRTLAWDGYLIAPFKGSGQRIRLDPGSVTFLNSGYQAAYLDLNLVPAGGNAPASAVKFGAYTVWASTQPDAYVGTPNQVPIFFFHSADDFGPSMGFPRPVITGSPTISALDPDDLVIKISAGLVSTYCKGATPGSNIYMQQLLVHLLNETNGTGTTDGNADLWRLAGCYEAAITPGTLNFTQGRTIMNGGEIECAIQEQGQPDYVGGVHGDERLTSVKLLVDGTEVPLDIVATLVGREVSYIQRSNIYRCNTATGEIICAHVKHTTLSRERGKLRIQPRQFFEWSKVVELRAAMIPMAPIKRLQNDTSGDQITDTAARSPRYELENVATSAFTPIVTVGEFSRCEIWGPTGVSLEMEILKTPAIATRSFYIANAVQYNKLYHSAAGNVLAGATYTTTVGERWETDAVVRVSTRS